jgi:acetylornithine deacetylase
MVQLRTTEEERVVEAVRSREGELLEVLATLIACDTTSRAAGDPPRDEEKLQRFLEQRLKDIGAATDLWEPEPTGTGNRHYADNLDFRGRPQLAGTVPGSGGGRSLLLNGHIDAVSVDTPAAWTSDAFKARVEDGLVFGRGANDMKGGLAAMLVAMQALVAENVRLAGDVTLCTVTDEESSGAGGWAAAARGISATGGLCAEPSNLRVYTACRGTVCPTITVHGREGHAEMKQPHWSLGGAVNAVEKMQVVLQAAKRLRDEWAERPDHQHPLLNPGDIVPTVIAGGGWPVTYPATCSLRFDCQYLPAQVDAEQTGRGVEREIIEWMEQAAAADPWLREHPLEWAWSKDMVPYEVPPDHPIVTTTLGAIEDLGVSSGCVGFDTWMDAATFNRFGTPMIAFGPSHRDTMHAVDECVPVEDLVTVAASIALLAMRWCVAK